MNGFTEPMSEESRPPVIGKEDSCFEKPFPVQYLDFPNMETCEVAECDSKNINGTDSFQNEGCEFMEHSPVPSPPNPGRWTVSLQCLLDDIQGTDLFQKYLIMENQDTKPLDFIFACRGVKKTAQHTDREKLNKLVHVLYEKKVKRIAAIGDDTKREIKRKIQSKEIDIHIFDVAQRQVEMDISNTTYTTFLQSDLYLQHLRSSSEGESERVASEEAECLPTLHEDSELHFNEKHQLILKKERIQRKLLRNSDLRRSRIEPGSIIKSPYSVNYSSYHARYGTCLPTSVQDSELQSISSGAQTDDTMSNCDSSVDYSMSRNKPKRLLDGKKYAINTDNLHELPKDFVSITQRKQGVETTRNPSDFHQELILKLNKVCEERKNKEKVVEKINSVESPDPSRPAASGCTSNPNQCKMESSVFDLFAPSEDNDQDILDRHVSRVFEDMGQTPVLSPVCVSPPAARPQVDVLPGTSLLGPQDLSYTNYQKSSLVSPFSVIGNPKQKQERDTRSSDSGAVTEWISEDNLAARSHENLVYQKQPFGRSSSKDQSRRSLRKTGPIFKSTTSFEDSGISEVYEPHASSLKMAHWLESKRCLPENDKEMKNSSTSPVLNRSYGQKILYRGESVMHNSLTFVSRATVMQPQPTAQDLTTSFRPDTTTNLIEARRRLEDDKKIGKTRHTSGTPRLRQSFRASDTLEEGLSQRKQRKDETIVIGYSYGQQSVPYLTRFHGRSITLRNFKSLLTKKGNFKYYFRRVDNAFGTGTVLEEVCDDQAILPLWEGKVFCVIETVDDLPTPEDCLQ